jgi:transmembrane sensor
VTIQEQKRVTYLLEQIRDARATPDDCQELLDILARHPSEAVVQHLNDFFKAPSTADPAFDYSMWASTLRDVLDVDKTPAAGSAPVKAPLHRIRLMSFIWMRAAAVILLLTAGVLIYVRRPSTPGPLTLQKNPVPVQNNVAAPSYNRAVLTLSGGKQVFVDSAGVGTVAVQNGVDIQKTADGRIIYNGMAPQNANAMNTLTVPRGSAIASIVLQDGSKVFLNAASSLTFPVVFNGNERSVQLTGEAYFEIAKDPQRKFVVTSGRIVAEVLGTHFNMNTYPDEEAIHVTLLEGSVKVSSGTSAAIIQPNTEAVCQGNTVQVNTRVDIDQVMAWKNGSFNFRNADLPAVMRQISRWYDVDIAYEGSLTTRAFTGEISRDITLMDLLDGLSRMNVHFLIDGKKLIVKP